ncbi:DUF3667 domain-containing protein [Novosphingobium sp.]|uniref:DUF3667 domain-containing protein n=1 Tax=Novosphingobium sp. TaxID=1874826 RepID=UPI003D13CF05
MSISELAGEQGGSAKNVHLPDSATDPTMPDDGHTHETACLNCGTPLVGPFCTECGQAAHAHRTLAAFFHDLLHGVLHFESSIWHTLPLVIARPGALTRRYINGQRTRFISPLALFLFCVFLLYASIQLTVQGTPPEPQRSSVSQTTQLQQVEAQISKLQDERRAEVAHHDDTHDTDIGIARLQGVLSSIRHGISPDVQSATITGMPTGLAFVDRVIASVRENPELVRYKVESHAYKYSWLLIPISVPFVWLMFPFDRRFPIYDHTVFVTYSISFMTLLSVIVLIADRLRFASFDWLIAAVVPVHMYRQLRGAYQCSWPGAVLRTFGLLVAAVIALGIFTVVIVAQSTD